MGVDAPAPAAEGGEGRVIDAVDRMGAGRGSQATSLPVARSTTLVDPA